MFKRHFIITISDDGTVAAQQVRLEPGAMYRIGEEKEDNTGEDFHAIRASALHVLGGLLPTRADLGLRGLSTAEKARNANAEAVVTLYGKDWSEPMSRRSAERFLDRL